MVLLLAAITLGLFSRVLGADNAPFCPIMAKGGRWRSSGCSGWRACGSSRQQDDERLALRVSRAAGPGPSENGRGHRRGCAVRSTWAEDMNPLIRFALAHAEQASVHHLEGISLEVGEQEEQPVFRGGQGASHIDGEATGRPGFPSSCPAAICAWNAASKGGTRTSNSSEGQAGEIQELHGAGTCRSVNRKPAIAGASFHRETQYNIDYKS